MEEVESAQPFSSLSRWKTEADCRATEMIAEADINHDGGVSFDEFVVVRRLR